MVQWQSSRVVDRVQRGGVTFHESGQDFHRSDAVVAAATGDMNWQGSAVITPAEHRRVQGPEKGAKMIPSQSPQRNFYSQEVQWRMKCTIIFIIKVCEGILCGGKESMKSDSIFIFP